MTRISYTLAVTVHDPHQRFCGPMAKLKTIMTSYPTAVAITSIQTSPKTTEALKQCGFITELSQTQGEIGTARKQATKLALKQNAANWIHYCDFDRLIHWQTTQPDELRSTLAQEPTSEYVSFGRTPAAWATHPKALIDAERVSNRAFAAALQLPDTIDMSAGSWLYSPKLAQLFITESIEPTDATDLEWPALAYKQFGIMPEIRLVDGMSFETADFYQTEIQQAGSQEKWLDEIYNTLPAWYYRAKLSFDSVAALYRVLNQKD